MPGILMHSLSFPNLQHRVDSPRLPHELQGMGPRPSGLCAGLSVSLPESVLGCLGCFHGFPEVLSPRGRHHAGPLRRHGPAKARAQQQNTKAPQWWRTNLLPRVLPACLTRCGANPGLGPRVPTQRGVAQSGGELCSLYPPQAFSLPALQKLRPLSPWLGLGPSSVLYSLPVTLPGCPQVGRKASLTWRKLGAHWDRDAGLPKKGLSETQILWDPSPGLPRDAPPCPTPCPTAPGTCRKEEDIR